MGVEYSRVTDSRELVDMYERMERERLLDAYIVHARMTLVDWLSVALTPTVLTLGAYIDGEMAGFLVGEEFCGTTSECMEVGVCAFRKWFKRAAEMARGGFLWCFDNLDCVSLIGRVPATNRHVLPIADKVGFTHRMRVPAMFWHERKQTFVDGYIMAATRGTVARSGGVE